MLRISTISQNPTDHDGCSDKVGISSLLSWLNNEGEPVMRLESEIITRIFLNSQIYFL